MEKENQITIIDNCCIKPISTLIVEHGQMPILSLSGASLLEKNNLRRAMKYFDEPEKIHVGADANQKITFHRPNVPEPVLTCRSSGYTSAVDYYRWIHI